MNPDRFRSLPRLLLRGALLSVLGGAAASCGGHSSPTEPMTGSTPMSTATIALMSGGVSVHLLTVAPGSTVTFTNDDSAPHMIASDPHPIHTQCPELNGPVLQPGGSFTATMANMTETCGFHDHLNPTNAAFQGTITVSR